MQAVELLKDVFLRAGVGWVLWILGALSVASVAVALERWLLFRGKRADLGALVRALEPALERGDLGAAAAALGPPRSTAAAVVGAGLRLLPRGVEPAGVAMQGALAVERSALEARLAVLATIGNNAPFVGLLGTVIGVLLAFEALGHGAASGAAGPAASAALMSAIAEALVTTAVGILVALPAVALHNVFQRRLARTLADAEALASLVVAHGAAWTHAGGLAPVNGAAAPHRAPGAGPRPPSASAVVEQ